jgi:hypothetical protein
VVCLFVYMCMELTSLSVDNVNELHFFPHWGIRMLFNFERTFGGWGESIYPWRKKVVCFVLFCSYEIHWTGMLQIVFLVSLESSWRGGVHGLSSITFGLVVQKVLEYWMISSLKIKLNCSWKFRRNWTMPLVFMERSWWAGFNGIHLLRFGFRMGDILILKWFLLPKIQINSKKPGFGRKNQLRKW